jgi:low temperature requirement protein LtrA
VSATADDDLLVTFTLSWKIWNDMAMIIAWFETDDIFQRVSILFLLACLFGYTTNIVEAFEHTYATLIGFYLTARLYMTAYLVLVACLVPMVRSVMLYYAAVALINSALWIASIHVPYPNQLALIFVALFLEISGQTSYIALLTLAQRCSSRLKSWAEAALDFHPALNIEHRVERTNAFVSLVFGYTVVAILYQSASPGIDAIFGKAILGLIQPFAYNWLYFELDGAGLASHAIRRAKVTAMTWSIAHLPFIMAFVLGGGGLARLVLATDIEGAHADLLTETYQARSEEEVAQGIRWFYCGGFGSALLFMCVISMSHVHKDLGGERLGKRFRLGVRAATAVVMICLPVARESLSSLGLVGTMTGLVLFTLVVEVWGASRKGTGFGVGGKRCGYVGRCGKGDLQVMLKEGGEVDIDVLGEKGGVGRSGVVGAPV